MKKFVLLVTSLLMLTGCNTPTKEPEVNYEETTKDDIIDKTYQYQEDFYHSMLVYDKAVVKGSSKGTANGKATSQNLNITYTYSQVDGWLTDEQDKTKVSATEAFIGSNILTYLDTIYQSKYQVFDDILKYYIGEDGSLKLAGSYKATYDGGSIKSEMSISNLSLIANTYGVIKYISYDSDTTLVTTSGGEETSYHTVSTTEMKITYTYRE